VGHPDNCYFNIGKIGDNQLQYLARRSGQKTAELQRLLAPNL
jgi:5-methyltetrahydrofolate--homocysteine methyltransferase